MSKETINNFNDKWLFIDPLARHRKFRHVQGAVLLAWEIKKYATSYNLLIENCFEEEKLKGASYSMTPDVGNNAWVFNENGEKEPLKKKKDLDPSGKLRYYYEIPSNSLVYVRLKQKLRLPYYIIGRFNLKVSYTYMGLLLGTGPQVDPGYNNQLNIPLHNFTNNPIKIYIDESFVTIDFVRTSPLPAKYRLLRSRSELFAPKNKKLYEELHPQDWEKQQRFDIEDYLDNLSPTSSLGKLVEDLKGDRRKFRATLTMIKFDAIAVAVLVIGMLALVYMWHQNLDARVEAKVETTRNIVRSSDSERLRTELGAIIQNTTQTDGKLNKLTKEFEKTQEDLDKRLKMLEGQKTSPSTKH